MAIAVLVSTNHISFIIPSLTLAQGSDIGSVRVVIMFVTRSKDDICRVD